MNTSHSNIDYFLNNWTKKMSIIGDDLYRLFYPNKNDPNFIIDSKNMIDYIYKIIITSWKIISKDDRVMYSGSFIILFLILVIFVNKLL